MTTSNIKTNFRLPRPTDNTCKDPNLLQEYLDSVIRNIELGLNNAFNSNNNTWIISPSTTASFASLSIAGNTASLSKVRDNLTSLIKVLKNNNRLN